MRIKVWLAIVLGAMLLAPLPGCGDDDNGSGGSGSGDNDDDDDDDVVWSTDTSAAAAAARAAEQLSSAMASMVIPVAEEEAAKAEPRQADRDLLADGRVEEIEEPAHAESLLAAQRRSHAIL